MRARGQLHKKMGSEGRAARTLATSSAETLPRRVLYGHGSAASAAPGLPTASDAARAPAIAAVCARCPRLSAGVPARLTAGRSVGAIDHGGNVYLIGRTNATLEHPKRALELGKSALRSGKALRRIARAGGAPAFWWPVGTCSRHPPKSAARVAMASTVATATVATVLPVRRRTWLPHPRWRFPPSRRRVRVRRVSE